MPVLFIEKQMQIKDSFTCIYFALALFTVFQRKCVHRLSTYELHSGLHETLICYCLCSLIFSHPLVVLEACMRCSVNFGALVFIRKLTIVNQEYSNPGNRTHILSNFKH